MFAILNSIQLLKIKIKIKKRFTFEKLFATLLTIILGACSMHHDTSKNDEDNKSDMKSNDPKNNETKDKSIKENNNKTK